MNELALAYAERGLDPRNIPVRDLPSFTGWTDEQIADYITTDSVSVFNTTPYASVVSQSHVERRTARGQVRRRTVDVRYTTYAVREVIVLTLSKHHRNALHVLFA